MPRHLHELADRRSLVLHERVAERLLTDPEVLERARRTVSKWRQSSSVSSVYVEAWARILTLTQTAILDVLRDRGETATMLRQVSPFAGALPPRERWMHLKHERLTRDG